MFRLSLPRVMPPSGCASARTTVNSNAELNPTRDSCSRLQPRIEVHTRLEVVKSLTNGHYHAILEDQGFLIIH